VRIERPGKSDSVRPGRQHFKQRKVIVMKSATKPIIGTIICGALAILTLFLTINAFSQWSNMQPLREGAVVIEGGKVVPENEGKLVLVSGRVTVEDNEVSDTQFDVTVKSPYLSRIVEMCQWKTINQKGTMAEYVIWSTELELKQQDFEGERYVNPDRFPFDASVFKADVPFMLGELELSEKLIEKYVTGRLTRVTELTQNGADKNSVDLDKTNNWYYYHSDFKTLVGNQVNTGIYDIGDARVFFLMLDTKNPGEITVMAKQQNGRLVAYDNGDISPIEVLHDGIKSKEEIIAAEQSDDNAGAVVSIVLTVIFAGLTVFFVLRILKAKKQR
jgi:hypothetical protein